MFHWNILIVCSSSSLLNDFTGTGSISFCGDSKISGKNFLSKGLESKFSSFTHRVSNSPLVTLGNSRSSSWSPVVDRRVEEESGMTLKWHGLKQVCDIDDILLLYRGAVFGYSEKSILFHLPHHILSLCCWCWNYIWRLQLSSTRYRASQCFPCLELTKILHRHCPNNILVRKCTCNWLPRFPVPNLVQLINTDSEIAVVRWICTVPSIVNTTIAALRGFMSLANLFWVCYALS